MFIRSICTSILLFSMVTGKAQDKRTSSAADTLAVATPDAEAWETVLITTNPDDVRGLTRIGEVSARSHCGGGSAQNRDEREVRKNAKRNTAKVGGTVFFLQDRFPVWGGVKMIGVAYK